MPIKSEVFLIFNITLCKEKWILVFVVVVVFFVVEEKCILEFEKSPQQSFNIQQTGDALIIRPETVNELTAMFQIIAIKFKL